MKQKWTTGYQPATELAGTLDNFQPLSIPVQRGTCYRVVLRLKPGAAFSDHAMRGLELRFVPQNGGAEIHGGPGFHGPGGVGTIGCPQQNTDMLLDLNAFLGAATDKSRVHDLGQGGFVAQVHTKSVSEQQLGEQQADTNRQIEEAREFQRQQRDKACRECRNQQLECLDGRRRPTFGDCTNEYRMCLQRRSVYNQSECP